MSRDFEEILRTEREIEALQSEYTTILFQRYVVRSDLRHMEKDLLQKLIVNIQLKAQFQANFNTVHTIRETDRKLRKVYMALKGPSITPVITNTIDKVIHYKNAELAKKEEEHNARIAELKAVQLKNPIMREANELEVSIKKLENVIAELDEKIASKSKEMGDCEKSLKEVTAEYLIKIQQLEDNLAANEEKERELMKSIKNHEQFEAQSTSDPVQPNAGAMHDDQEMDDNYGYVLQKLEIDETLPSHCNFDDDSFNLENFFMKTDAAPNTSESMTVDNADPPENINQCTRRRRADSIDQQDIDSVSLESQNEQHSMPIDLLNTTEPQKNDTTPNFVVPTQPPPKRKERSFDYDMMPPAKKPHYNETRRLNQPKSSEEKNNNRQDRHVHFSMPSVLVPNPNYRPSSHIQTTDPYPMAATDNTRNYGQKRETENPQEDSVAHKRDDSDRGESRSGYNIMTTTQRGDGSATHSFGRDFSPKTPEPTNNRDPRTRFDDGTSLKSEFVRKENKMVSSAQLGNRSDNRSPHDPYVRSAGGVTSPYGIIFKTPKVPTATVTSASIQSEEHPSNVSKSDKSGANKSPRCDNNETSDSNRPSYGSYPRSGTGVGNTSLQIVPIPKTSAQKQIAQTTNASNRPDDRSSKVSSSEKSGDNNKSPRADRPTKEGDCGESNDVHSSDENSFGDLSFKSFMSNKSYRGSFQSSDANQGDDYLDMPFNDSSFDYHSASGQSKSRQSSMQLDFSGDADIFADFGEYAA